MEHRVSLSLSLDDKFSGSFADDLISQFDLKRGRLYALTDTEAGSALPSNNDSNNHNSDDISSLHGIAPTPLALESRTHHSSEEESDLDKLPTTNENSASQESPSPTRPQSSQPDIESSSLSQPEEHVHPDMESSDPSQSVAAEEEEHTSPPIPEVVDMPAPIAAPSPPTPSPNLQIDDHSLPSPPPIPLATRRQNNTGLLRRSSTFLRQRFFSGAPHTPANPPPPPPPPSPPTSNDVTPTQQISESDKTIHSPGAVPALPCQYPPKPLSYCPVDPLTDNDQPRRTSFPTLVPWRKKSFQDPRRQSEPTVTAPSKGRRAFFF